MSFLNSKKLPQEEPVYENREVWQCKSCTCWAQKEYVLEDVPTCPLCHEPMEPITKLIRLS